MKVMKVNGYFYGMGKEMAEAGVGLKARKKVAPIFVCPYFLFLLFLLPLLPRSSVAYYVGPEVGHAPSETRLVVKTGGIIPGARNVSSLAEAAYVPYVYSVGNNVVTFLRSIVPALQPKVDFFAEQIQDGIDIANNKLMQTLENSNNGIIAVENFFTGLMKAVVFGKGPEEEERRRRFAMALIRSGMLNVTTLGTTSTTTSTTTTTTTTTGSPIENIVTQRLVRGATTTVSSTDPVPATTNATNSPDLSNIPDRMEAVEHAVKEISSNELNPMKEGKTRDNQFNKMRVISIVKNMLEEP